MVAQSLATARLMGHSVWATFVLLPARRQLLHFKEHSVTAYGLLKRETTKSGVLFLVGLWLAQLRQQDLRVFPQKMS